MALANITNNILTDTGVNVANLTPTSTTISTTAPLQGGGDLSANRTLSITQSSASVNGYLSSGDWTIFNSKQPAGTYITSLTGEATGTGPGATAVTLNNASVTAKILTGVNITGGTVQATDTMLTAFGKLQNQINGLIGSSIYQGTWNASTNTPTLTSSVGTRGYYYIVSVAGTTNLNGITDWFVGDWVIFDGTAWQQVDNTDAVVSVNGQTGAVSLTTDNIAEGATNQYFLNSRARAALSFAAGSGAYNSTTGVITIPTNNNQITNGSNYITLTSLSGTAPIVYSNTTGAISITQSGTASNGYLSSTDWNTFNNKQATLSLTTTGTSGAATLIANVLNVPNYGGALTGYVPYTGATANVDLGAYSLTAGAATLTSNLWLKNTGSYDFIISNNTSLTTNVVRAYYTTTDELRFYAKNTAGASVVPKIMVGDGTTFTQLGTGTVTSVAALTIGTSGTDLSSTVANSTTTPVITLNVPTASATNRGVLASADWTTFNSKQGTITLTTTGTSGVATFSANTLNIPNYGSALSGYLPLTGGTLTGALNGTTANFTGSSTFAQTSTSASITTKSQTGTAALLMQDNTAANKFEIGHYLGNYYIYSFANSTQALTLTGSGNLGLGVTPSAWGSGYTALQIPSGTYGGGSFFSDNGSPAISANAYNNAGWKFVNADYATIYQSRSGQHQWFTSTTSGSANAAITFTQAMTLNASGRLLVGNGITDNGASIQTNGDIRADYSSSIYLQINGGATGDYRKGFSGINQQTGVARGLHIFNYDPDSSQGIKFFGGTYAAKVRFGGFDSGGNFFVNSTDSAEGYKFYVNGTLGVTGAATFSSSVTAAGGRFTSPVTINGSSIPSDRLFEVTGSTGTVFGMVLNPTWTYTGTNIYGIYAGNNFNTGTITNSYNLYIEATNTGSATVANKYGIYQAGSGDKNYFAGNVGIGTSSPTYKFETLGTSVITAAFGRSDYGASNVMLIAMNGYRDVYKQAIGVVRTGDYDKGDMIFCLNGSANSTVVSASDERMRITSGGNVNINNTTNTTYKLSTYNNVEDTHVLIAGLAPSVRFKDTVTSHTYSSLFGMATVANNFITGSAAGDFAITWESTKKCFFGYTNTTAIMVLDNGNLGLGTLTIGSKAQINGNLAVGYSSSTAAPTNGILSNGGFKSSNPTGDTAQTWKLGSAYSGSGISQTHYVNVEVNGVIYALLASNAV